MRTLLQLKVIWRKELLAIALANTPDNNEYLLTPYYFWPRTKAWEQLKLELETMLWLTDNERITLLNLAADLINHWQKERTNETDNVLKKRFDVVKFI